MAIIKAKYNNLVRPYMRIEKQGFGSLYGGNQVSDVSNSERLENIVNSSTDNMFVGNRLLSYTNLNTGQQLVFTNDSVFIVDNSTSSVTEIDTQVALQFINESEWVPNGQEQTPINNSFEFSVDTRITAGSSSNSSSNQFKLPLDSTATDINFIVDWGDSNSNTITQYNQSETTHTYSTEGVYYIKITGQIKGWKFNNGGDKRKMLNISNWGAFEMSTDKSFIGCVNMDITATDTFSVSSTSLANSFKFCGSITTFDWAKDLNLSGVSNVSQMFRNSSFNGDISSWDITLVSNGLNFMDGLTATFSEENYESLLIGWESTMQESYPNGVGYSLTPTWHFDGGQYSAGSQAEVSRASLINNFNWTIIDGGVA